MNVVSPLRWLHSLVTDKIATIGSSTVIGTPIAAPKESYVIELSEANRITAPVARVAAIAMLAISQKPDRVSNILRSSTPTIRPIGMPSMRFGRGRTRCESSTSGWVVRVVMLLLLLVRCPR